MDVSEAVNNANQILDEERASPTVAYKLAPTGDQNQPFAVFSQISATMSTPHELQLHRVQRPREVVEDATRWTFYSRNYNLFCQILTHVEINSRQSFIGSLLLRLASLPNAEVVAKTVNLLRDRSWACRYESGKTFFPNWRNLVSEMPLLIEFCVRNGGTQQLFRILGEANPSPGHVLLLLQLEELIAFNFTRFTQAEYLECVEPFLRSFQQTTRRILSDIRKKTPAGLTERQASPEFMVAGVTISLWLLCDTCDKVCTAILEQCRKARYFYLAGQLETGLNLEINQDKTEVQVHLASFGFDSNLSRSLDEAERLYRDGHTDFELKASMGHLRSFLENVQEEALPLVARTMGDAAPKGWGAGLKYLKRHGVISEQEEKFAASLYTLISDEAVHPLVAERESARLSRNMVIEYALMFLKKLDKLGLKPQK